MASYNCNEHDGDGNGDDEIKMDCKHHHHEEMQGHVAMEAIGGHLEYWTPTTKNMCGSIINYGDVVEDHMLQLPKVNGNCDVQSCWRDLTGASRTSSVSAKSFGGASLQQQGRVTVEDKECDHGRVLKVGGDSEEVDAIDGNRQGYDVNTEST